MAYISRDPFAREELHRRTEETTQSCAWCGQTRKSGTLFRYVIEPDSCTPRDHIIKGLFCSIDCMREYHS